MTSHRPHALNTYIRYIVRDFTWTDDIATKTQEDLAVANTTEKELWTELLRLSRINFSESFQVLVHLKIVRLFVESVLRYGLPANYTGVMLKPEVKGSKKALQVLGAQFSYLGKRSTGPKGKGKGGQEEVAGEYQSLMDQEFFDYVVYEVPWIVG
jgi:V-type H+-transporting ATPase subunit C